MGLAKQVPDGYGWGGTHQPAGVLQLLNEDNVNCPVRPRMPGVEAVRPLAIWIEPETLKPGTASRMADMLDADALSVFGRITFKLFCPAEHVVAHVGHRQAPARQLTFPLQQRLVGAGCTRRGYFGAICRAPPGNPSRRPGPTSPYAIWAP